MQRNEQVFMKYTIFLVSDWDGFQTAMRRGLSAIKNKARQGGEKK